MTKLLAPSRALPSVIAILWDNLGVQSKMQLDYYLYQML